MRARVHDRERACPRGGAADATRRAAGAMVSAARDRRGETPTIARARAWLADYFAGACAAFPDDLPLDMRGAPFEKRVWAALQAHSARRRRPATARSPKRARISRRVARRRRRQRRQPHRHHRALPPRDRLVSGSLTGYGGGLDRKTWLLDHETPLARRAASLAVLTGPYGREGSKIATRTSRST